MTDSYGNEGCAKFEVSIERTIRTNTTVVVAADSEDEAWDRASDIADGLDASDFDDPCPEHEDEIEVEGCVECDEDDDDDEGDDDGDVEYPFDDGADADGDSVPRCPFNYASGARSSSRVTAATGEMPIDR